MYFHFKIISLRNSGALHLNRLDSPSHMDNLCQVWLKLTHWFWRRRFLNFCYFVIISPWKTTGPFIWTNLNPLHPRMLRAKFGWNWPSGFGEEDENVKSWPQQRRQKSGFLNWSSIVVYRRNQTTFSVATQNMLNFPKTFNKKYNINLSLWEFTVKKKIKIFFYHVPLYI